MQDEILCIFYGGLICVWTSFDKFYLIITSVAVIPPSIDSSSDRAIIVVPEEVANSQVGFSETGIMVDDGKNIKITIHFFRTFQLFRWCDKKYYGGFW